MYTLYYLDLYRVINENTLWIHSKNQKNSIVLQKQKITKNFHLVSRIF